jgi:hypothetical protein
MLATFASTTAVGLSGLGIHAIAAALQCLMPLVQLPSQTTIEFLPPEVSADDVIQK